MYKVETYGQVFTPIDTVTKMIKLIKYGDRILEPSAGDGAFFKFLKGRNETVGIEIDDTHAPDGAYVMDFFDYPTSEKFDTIIGNPPYVAYKNIPKVTLEKLKGFDKRTNLYIFFIDKCLSHMADKGELIFITPRDFLKATSAINLNKTLYNLGTIDYVEDLGDNIVFKKYSPNCLIWRFEKGNMSHKTTFIDQNGVRTKRNFKVSNGQILFIEEDKYVVNFDDLFFVKVGAVSGCDSVFIFEDSYKEDESVKEFVCSETVDTGKLRKMYYFSPFSKDCPKNQKLLSNKNVLINRKIKKYDESNWWHWGRHHFISDLPRVYVNCKTRKSKPFFRHDCINYDGSVMAIFIKEHVMTGKSRIEKENKVLEMLNSVDWKDLGFMCNNRFLFSQKALSKTMLPSCFLSL